MAVINKGRTSNSMQSIGEVSPTPTLQEVTDEGATTTNPIETGNIVATDVNGGDAPFYGKYDSGDSIGKIIMEDVSTNFNHQLRFNMLTAGRTVDFKDESGVVAFDPIAKTSNFTATLDQQFTTNGTIAVTDPTGVTNKGYIVHVIGGTSTIGGIGYTTGALVYRFYNGSTWASVDMSNGISTQRSTATSGTESAPDTSNEVVFIHEAGATVSLTYEFPPNPIDKQRVTVMSVGGITTLTLSAVVGSIINTITTLAGGGCATYMYLASQTKWYKIG